MHPREQPLMHRRRMEDECQKLPKVARVKPAPRPAIELHEWSRHPLRYGGCHVGRNYLSVIPLLRGQSGKQVAHHRLGCESVRAELR